jgi:hypothetical protein
LKIEAEVDAWMRFWSKERWEIWASGEKERKATGF